MHQKPGDAGFLIKFIDKASGVVESTNQQTVETRECSPAQKNRADEAAQVQRKPDRGDPERSCSLAAAIRALKASSSVTQSTTSTRQGRSDSENASASTACSSSVSAWAPITARSRSDQGLGGCAPPPAREPKAQTSRPGSSRARICRTRARWCGSIDSRAARAAS